MIFHIGMNLYIIGMMILRGASQPRWLEGNALVGLSTLTLRELQPRCLWGVGD
jgi:hypothetical protein